MTAQLELTLAMPPVPFDARQCPECRVPAGIHRMAMPKYEFPCPEGSWEQDRQAFEDSIKLGPDGHGWIYTRVSYALRFDPPSWFKSHTMTDKVVRSMLGCCYGSIHFEKVRA